MTHSPRWVAALLCALLALVGSVAPAAAAPRPNPVPLAALADLDPSVRASLTIHKLQGRVGGSASTTGRVKPPPTSQPIAGVTYQVTRIDGVDLTTMAGWALVQSYADDLVKAAAAPGQTFTPAATGKDGTTTLTGLPVGLYFVRELSRPAGVSASRDALVTLPIADPSHPEQWLYDVDLYPKPLGILPPGGDQPGIEKSVADGNLGRTGEDAPVAGSILTFTLTAGLPAPGLGAFGGSCVRSGQIDQGVDLDPYGFTADGTCAAGATWTGSAGGAAYRIVDDLTSSIVPGTTRPTSDFLTFLAPTAPTVTLLGETTVTLTACAAGGTPCDYTLTLTATRLQVDLSDAGMAKVAAAKAADEASHLVVRVPAAVLPTVTTATTIQTAAGPAPVLTLPNTALLFPNGTAVAEGTSTSSETVVTIFSTLRLHKLDSATGAPLAGAVFTIYRSRADAVAGRNPLAVAAPTGADGLTQIPGLHVTDFQNNAADDDSYWAVETTAPDGYVGLSGPFEVKLSKDGTTLAADSTGGYPVANTRSGGWLPNTGADVDLGLVGAAMLATLLGVGLVAVGRRRTIR